MTAVIINTVDFCRRFESRTLCAGISTSVDNRKIQFFGSVNNRFSQIHVEGISEVNKINKLLFARVVAGFATPGVINDLIRYGNGTDIVLR